MQSLTDLANRYGSDKGTVGPSADWPAHHYTDIYESYLGTMRDAPIALLEIGLGVSGERWDAKIVQGRNTGGASIKMWRDFFPRARIYGIDVNQCSYLDDERVRTFVADQGSLDDLAEVVRESGEPAFDVIVDDGSHRPDHQQIALGFLFGSLRPGGFYFIEDLMANGFGDGRTGRMACEDVLNTRAVLKHFAATASFPEPHALTDPERLAQDIAEIHFHSPGLPTRQRVPGTEPLCAIRKRPA